jgi:hypothetical protein
VQAHSSRRRAGSRPGIYDSGWVAIILLQASRARWWLPDQAQTRRRAAEPFAELQEFYTTPDIGLALSTRSGPNPVETGSRYMSATVNAR